jgi:hypothetical protein
VPRYDGLDYEITDFKPMDGWSIVYMTEDNGFRFEKCPGVLIMRDKHGDLTPVAARLHYSGGQVAVISDCIGVFSDEEASRKFEGAEWKLDVDDDIIIWKTDGGKTYARLEYRIYVSDDSKRWKLNCMRDALPSRDIEKMEISLLNELESRNLRPCPSWDCEIAGRTSIMEDGHCAACGYRLPVEAHVES